MRNVGALLDQHIKEEESRASMSESASSDKYSTINGEQLLIYFLLFVLMLTIACFVLGVFLKNRLGRNSAPGRQAAARPHNFNIATNTQYSTLGDQKSTATQVQGSTKYEKVATNNNDLANQNLNANKWHSRVHAHTAFFETIDISNSFPSHSPVTYQKRARTK